MMRGQGQSRRRLKKQPRVRRVQAASAGVFPRIKIPATAQQRRKRNRRRLRLPTAALQQAILSARWLSLGLLALSVYALFFIGQSDAFYLTHIPVEGNHYIPANEVVADSGLGGVHIFAADPVAAAKAVGEMPGVITATVTLHWPNQVMIEIGEDSPIAIWEQAGELFWINEKGRLFKARLDLPNLLHIRSEQEEPLNEARFVSPEVIEAALLLQTLRPNIDFLYYEPGSGLSYQDGRGWRAYFGVGQDMEQRLVIYETIVEDLLARGLSPTYISVSNKEKPFYHAP